MEDVRYLSFEINNQCNLAGVHSSKCPIAHPLRYRNSPGRQPLEVDLIVQFWEWARFTRNFRGVVNWNLYNEPTLAIAEIRHCMARMRTRCPDQKFMVITNSSMALEDVDQVLRSGYGKDGGLHLLDRRLEVECGEGPYHGPGCCLRGQGFEVVVDYYGNWCLCCNDWQNEISIGNIHREDWDHLHGKWKGVAKRYRWTNEREFAGLPRWCRRCLSVCDLADVTPLLRAVSAGKP